MTTPAPTHPAKALHRRVSPARRSPKLSLKSVQTLIFFAMPLAVASASRAEIVTDTSSPVVDTIPLVTPNSPALGGIAASPNGKDVYVAIAEGESIAVLNASTHQISSVIQTLASPIFMEVSPDGTTLYVTDEASDLEAIALPIGGVLFTLPVGSNPQLVAVSPDNTKVYVPAIDGTVTAIDYEGPTFSTTISVGGEADQVVFNADGTKAYVSNAENSAISVINTVTDAVTTITTPGPTIGLAIRGTTLYATGMNAVFVINTKTQKVETIDVPSPANAFLAIPTLTPDGKFLYVPVVEITSPSGPGQTVVVINTATKKIEGQPIVVGLGPIQMAVTSGGDFGFLSNEFEGTVSVIKLLK